MNTAMTMVVLKNELPGRAKWMLRVTLANGSHEFSWHRTRSAAVDSWNARIAWDHR